MLELTFISGGTVQGPYPDTTEDVLLVYILGEEEASAEVAFPAEECPPGTTTTVPGDDDDASGRDDVRLRRSDDGVCC